jgi:hypothetical protein
VEKPATTQVKKETTHSCSPRDEGALATHANFALNEQKEEMVVSL